MSLDKRRSGILMHISSLPSSYGIGKLGKEAEKFIDFLSRTGTEYWQILPLSQTSYGDSPYQSFSVHAGNPYFIDFETLHGENLLKESDYKDIDWGSDIRHVDYFKIYKNCNKVLKIAYNHAKAEKDADFEKFKKDNSFWLHDYSLFMSLKDENGGKPWNEWSKDLANRNKAAIAAAEDKLAENIDFYSYTQYQFFKQWKNIKNYAHKRGIKIIGDIPIYVSYDSVDVWKNHELFQLKEDGTPIAVAGCPPDIFAKTGQLWGNPLYDWDYHKKTKYAWWKKRIATTAEFYDVVRLDHFRGFAGYYSIPYPSKTAEHGTWKKGPGIDFFKSLKDEFDKIDVIAEDLGFITDDVHELLDETGFPGMKVIEFAFDGTSKSEYLPHNFKNTNCIVYTGTHDNDTLLGWTDKLDNATLKYLRNFFAVRNAKDIPEQIIRLAWGSIAKISIAQIQDFLMLPASARMNTPSTLGGNWEFRTISSDFNARLLRHIKELNKLYNRYSEEENE